jgi:hypothetical protein
MGVIWNWCLYGALMVQFCECHLSLACYHPSSQRSLWQTLSSSRAFSTASAGICGRDISHLVRFLHSSSLSTHTLHLYISLSAAGMPLPVPCYTQACPRRKGAGAYERSQVHLTTTSSSCLMGDGILIFLPYHRHLNHPHQTRHLSIFLLLKPPTLPDLPKTSIL